MAEKVEKERLDVLLVEKGLANSRELAKAYIMAGNVYVDGQKEDKAGTKVAVNADIEVKGSQMKYVSRGGYKLEKPSMSLVCSWKVKSVWILVHLQAALQTVCCRMAQARCMPSMLAMASLHGNCVRMNVWFAWKKQM